MKPKEFDELVRQRFDRDDFEYDSRNWDKLEEQLDGRAKKRSIIMWWLMPVAGIAASVALAMGVPAMWQTPARQTAVNTEMPQTRHYEQLRPVQDMPVAANEITNYADVHTGKSIKKNKQRHSVQNEEAKVEKFSINIDNAITSVGVAHKKDVNFLAEHKEIVVKDKKNAVAAAEAHGTFKPVAEVQRAPKVSIVLSGGISHGNQNSGYTAGATVRRMLNDKLYIESDVALTSSTNTQFSQYLDKSAPVSGGSSYQGVVARTSAGVAARTTAIESNKPSIVPAPVGVIKEASQSYDLYYAQVSPSIGYKIIKRMSVGVGPDFQQMLVDNRPAPSTVDRRNIEVAPIFDIGLIGKTEYSLTKKVKAAVSYRKGINNILTPMDKYLDRDYLQFQVKCTVFNR